MTETEDNEWLTFYHTIHKHPSFHGVFLLDGTSQHSDYKDLKSDIDWSKLLKDEVKIHNKYLFVKTIEDMCEFRTYVEITDESEKMGALMVKYEDVRFVGVYKEKDRAAAQKVVYDYFKNAGENEGENEE